MPDGTSARQAEPVATMCPVPSIDPSARPRTGPSTRPGAMPIPAAGLAALARQVFRFTHVDIRQYRPALVERVLAQLVHTGRVAGDGFRPGAADAWALTTALEAQAWAADMPPPCPARLQQALHRRPPSHAAAATPAAQPAATAAPEATAATEPPPWQVWLPACPDARLAARWRQRLRPVLGDGLWLVTRSQTWREDEPGADGLALRSHNALHDPPVRCPLVIGHGLLSGLATHVQRRLLRQLADTLGPYGLLWLPLEAEAAARALGWQPAEPDERPGPVWWHPPALHRAVAADTAVRADADAATAGPPTAEPMAAADLARAMRRQELVLHYQPQFDLVTGQASGVEALLRWQHPVRGLLGPAPLVQAAESSGGIHVLGRWVLHEACRQLARWQAEGHAVGRIAVNVSTLQWLRPQFVDEVLASLAAAGLSPERLVLELTESRPWPDTPGPGRALARCREAGIGLSLDDFGSGHAGPLALQRLPLTQLKIDRGLLAHVPGDTRAEARLRRGVALARAMRLEVVVEGVQQPAQLAWVRGLGAHAYQGHLGAPALDARAAALHFG